jgi:hypothetical protein
MVTFALDKMDNIELSIYDEQSVDSLRKGCQRE